MPVTAVAEMPASTTAKKTKTAPISTPISAPEPPAPAVAVKVPEPAKASVNGDGAKPKAAKKKATKKKAKKAVVFSTEDIALRAYFIAEHRHHHGLHGDAHSDWVEAERQLKKEHKKAEKKKPAAKKKKKD